MNASATGSADKSGKMPRSGSMAFLMTSRFSLWARKWKSDIFRTTWRMPISGMKGKNIRLPGQTRLRTQGQKDSRHSASIMGRQVFPVFSDYYGLSGNPFDKQMTDRLGFFQSHDHREMTTRLNYLKDIRGVGVFTAQPGMGKTCSFRCFLKGLNRNLYRAAYLCLSTVSITEFYRQLCGALGLEGAFSKPAM